MINNFNAFDNFSWSLYRSRLFRRCRRGYYFNYYGAVGGHDVFSNVDIRKIYILKNSISAFDWADRIFAKSVREALLEAPADRRKARHNALYRISRILQKHFSRGRAECLSGNWVDDPKKNNIIELYTDASRAESLFAKVKERLNRELLLLTESDIFDDLVSTSPLFWKRFSLPVNFHVAAVSVWSAPDLVRQFREYLEFFIFSTAKREPEEDALAAALDRNLAKEKFLIEPERCRDICFNFYSGEVRLRQPATALELEKRITSDSQAMLELINLDGSVDPDRFPPGEDRGQCEQCRFRTVCVS